MNNFCSIQQIPAHLLPPTLRQTLLHLAECGADVYAYTSAGSHEWQIWLHTERFKLSDLTRFWVRQGASERGEKESLIHE